MKHALNKSCTGNVKLLLKTTCYLFESKFCVNLNTQSA